MYQHRQFEVLLGLWPSKSEQLANNQLLYTYKTLTLTIVKDDVVETTKSYSFEQCRNVKNLQDPLARSNPLLSLALKGFNSVMLYVDTIHSPKIAEMNNKITLFQQQQATYNVSKPYLTERLEKLKSKEYDLEYDLLIYHNTLEKTKPAIENEKQ
ncbi:hypothetical protein BC941DRAFT_512434 [Chlamydoabsidia padenii]|nr:hypothetical protein BC941DRAFT_512434 [Chlamydoabsidia padenii]